MCQERGKHFVLVHGACHGAWCWYKLKPLLQAAGHRVTALDLGGCGVHPSRLDEIVSLSDYLQPLMDFMASLVGDDDKDRVVLVGHSFGGLGVSLAMERFPEKISVAVFITAYMPNYKHPPATLIQEDVELAKMLLKPNGLFVQDLVQESILTEARYGSVRRVYVVCEEDGVMGEEFQRWLIENSPPKAVKSMAKAGHMVMLSKPKELALCLKNIVDQYH
ncbi:methylesterase 10-like isoform X2 [Rhododendron vialii]|uniref:methylesterase 10-like isoform X2 n=1 Tax=Rhododendron vialii TaxID=182163 RepID=UPI00266008DF|nr:methylesterase 10-like isoform X2 [Rhododendron vialii]